MKQRDPSSNYSGLGLGGSAGEREASPVGHWPLASLSVQLPLWLSIVYRPVSKTSLGLGSSSSISVHPPPLKIFDRCAELGFPMADGGSPRGSPGGILPPLFSFFYRLVRGGSFAAP